MSFFQKLFGTSKSSKVPAMQMGHENPFTTKTFHRADGMAYRCPTCNEPVGLQLAQVDPITGVRVLCESCRNLAHVPGIVTRIPKDTNLEVTTSETVKVVAGVRVPIIQFSDWYHAHPITKALYESRRPDYHSHYGVWAFCDYCHHEYRSNLLPTFTVAHHTKSFVFNAHSPQSKRDMDGLMSGKCPDCGGGGLIAIVTDIPDYVLERIQEFEKTGA